MIERLDGITTHEMCGDDRKFYEVSDIQELLQNLEADSDLSVERIAELEAENVRLKARILEDGAEIISCYECDKVRLEPEEFYYDGCNVLCGKCVKQSD